MRLLVLIAVLVFVYAVSNAQDCTTLNQTNVFHGIKLGFKFPDSLKRIFRVDKDSNSVSYNLYFDDVLKDDKLNHRFASWFYFKENFTMVSYDCLPDNKVFSYALMFDLHWPDSIPIGNSFADRFKNISAYITSIWGEKTKDDIENNLFGQQLIRQWTCNNIKIELTLQKMNVGSPFIDLAFTDVALEKQYKLNSLNK